MQKELITDKHRELLKKDFGVEFDDIEKMEETDYEAVLNNLAMAECDEDDKADGDEYTERGKLVSEIIDIICGPYDDDDEDDD